MSENKEDWKKTDPFGGKRFKRLRNPKNINVSVEEEILNGCEKLAYLDTRSLRDWIRMLLKREVEGALKSGLITPGPLAVAEETKPEETPEPVSEGA